MLNETDQVKENNNESEESHDYNDRDENENLLADMIVKQSSFKRASPSKKIHYNAIKVQARKHPTLKDTKQFSSSSLFVQDESRALQPLSTNSGGRPLAIDNSDIEGEHPGQLSTNLMMYRDFVTVPQKAWALFQSWYGVS